MHTHTHTHTHIITKTWPQSLVAKNGKSTLTDSQVQNCAASQYQEGDGGRSGLGCSGLWSYVVHPTHQVGRQGFVWKSSTHLTQSSTQLTQQLATITITNNNGDLLSAPGPWGGRGGEGGQFKVLYNDNKTQTKDKHKTAKHITGKLVFLGPVKQSNYRYCGSSCALRDGAHVKGASWNSVTKKLETVCCRFRLGGANVEGETVPDCGPMKEKDLSPKVFSLSVCGWHTQSEAVSRWAKLTRRLV